MQAVTIKTPSPKDARSLARWLDRHQMKTHAEGRTARVAGTLEQASTLVESWINNSSLALVPTEGANETQLIVRPPAA